MHVDVRLVLEDCIERGINAAMLNRIPTINDSAFAEYIEQEVWLQIDQYFMFNDHHE